MRAAAILGPGCSERDLKPFQRVENVDWHLGMPLASDKNDVILLFGGDGTIHRHLHELVGLALPVLVVPAGSGNDFARSLGFRRKVDSLAAWRNFRDAAGHRKCNVRTIDLGLISPLETKPSGASTGNRVLRTRYFCSVAGLGLDTEVTRLANQLPRWLRGHGGYAITALSTMFRFAPLPMKISTSEDGEVWTTRSHQTTILAAFANSPIYGDGMKIAPQARLDDGQLDVCVIGAMDPFKLACMFPTVYFGKHLRLPEVEYFRSAQARIETEYPLDIFADGEYVCQTPVEIGIQSAALQVITPYIR